MSDRLLTTREVADRLAVSPETVLRRHRSGKLPGGRGTSVTMLERVYAHLLETSAEAARQRLDVFAALRAQEAADG